MSLTLGNTERRTDPMTTTRVLGIAAVILAVLILAGVVLFLMLGRHPVPLLESSLLISG